MASDVQRERFDLEAIDSDAARRTHACAIGGAPRRSRRGPTALKRRSSVTTHMLTARTMRAVWREARELAWVPPIAALVTRAASSPATDTGAGCRARCRSTAPRRYAVAGNLAWRRAGRVDRGARRDSCSSRARRRCWPRRRVTVHRRNRAAILSSSACDRSWIRAGAWRMPDRCSISIPPDSGRSARDAMARAVETCVHCGFCLPACPTYKVLGEEMDSPRGRIVLMKEVLEGTLPLADAQPHIDRCLGCLGCVTACPSGVQYQRPHRPVPRRTRDRRTLPIGRLQRRLLLATLESPSLFRASARLGRVAKRVGRLLPARCDRWSDCCPVSCRGGRGAGAHGGARPEARTGRRC